MNLTPGLTPGANLSAATALMAGQQDYTAAQVAYLLAAAYDMGRAHGAADAHDERDAGLYDALCTALGGNPDDGLRAAVTTHQHQLDARDARQATDAAIHRLHDHPGGPIPWAMDANHTSTNGEAA